MNYWSLSICRDGYLFELRGQLILKMFRRIYFNIKEYILFGGYFLDLIKFFKLQLKFIYFDFVFIVNK